MEIPHSFFIVLLSGFKGRAFGFTGTAGTTVDYRYTRRLTSPFFVINTVYGIANDRQRMIRPIVANVIGYAAGDSRKRIAMGILTALSSHTANVDFMSATTMLRIAAAMDHVARQMIFHFNTSF